MSKPWNRAGSVATRKLYRFEDGPLRLLYPHLFTQITFSEALTFGHRVWDGLHGAGEVPPVIQYGRGTPHGDRRFSFCLRVGEGFLIDLVEDQRDKITILHEIAHAPTWTARIDHGPEFLQAYFTLLERWTDVDYDWLVLEYGDPTLFRKRYGR